MKSNGTYLGISLQRNTEVICLFKAVIPVTVYAVHPILTREMLQVRVPREELISIDEQTNNFGDRGKKISNSIKKYICKNKSLNTEQINKIV